MAFPVTIEQPKFNWLPGERPIGHTAHHNMMAILLYSIQQKIGVDGSIDTNSLDYKTAQLATALTNGLALKANISGGNSFFGSQNITGNLQVTGTGQVGGNLHITKDDSQNSTTRYGNDTYDWYVGLRGDTSNSFAISNGSGFALAIDTARKGLFHRIFRAGHDNSQSGQILEANGSDHVYFAWLVNLVRKAYMGFTEAGLQTLNIVNEFVNGDIDLKTNGTGQVKVNGVAIPMSSSGVPTGMVSPFAGSSAPGGFLLCNGSAVSRTTYSTLFTIIGTTYGVGDGSTTFNIPNLKGKVVVGQDVGQTEFNVLGETGGAKTHTLSITEIPSHTHNVSAPASNANASGSIISSGNYGSNGTNPETSSAGGGQAHNNLQPYIVLNYIIKT